MKINKHICFSKEKAPELVDYLLQNGIPFNCTGSLLTIDIQQDSPYWNDICDIVERKKLTCLSQTTFSKKELEEAQWLCVRSKWMQGYPQPESNFAYQSITYDDSRYCKECGSGLYQQSPFRLKSYPKWGSRHFMMVNWIYDELFIDECTKEILQNSSLSGFQFTNVENKNGSAFLPNIYQLAILKKSAAGLIGDQASIQHIYTCSCCGRKKFHPSGIGMFSIRKNVLDNMPDICKSSDFVGWGASAHHLILIRQSLYRLICEHHLDRGLIFCPINLV